MHIKNYLFILLIISGCSNNTKPKCTTDELLECVLWHLIEVHNPSTNNNIVIRDMQNWSDSSSYISTIIDVANLYDIEGELWVTTYRNMKINLILGSVDYNSIRNQNDLGNITVNKLKWHKQVIKRKSESIAQFYDPPTIDFIYNTKRKCIEAFMGSSDLVNILNKECQKCK